MQICNGMPQNEKGLLSHCAFSDFPFYTCVRAIIAEYPFVCSDVFWCFSTVAPKFNLPQTTLTPLSKSLMARTLVSDVRFRPNTSVLHDTDVLYSTPELLHPLLGPYRRKVYLYVGPMCFRR